VAIVTVTIYKLNVSLGDEKFSCFVDSKNYHEAIAQITRSGYEYTPETVSMSKAAAGLVLHPRYSTCPEGDRRNV